MAIKKITLKRLTIENFKGIRALEVDFNNNDTVISGANGTGKTTVYDAYAWLLFDKDSQDKKNFEIKPKEKNGEEVHMVNTTVKGEFTVIKDGKEKPLTLEKVYFEKWTKKRGEAESEFAGNTTEYCINGAPAKMSEYNEYIAKLISEDKFKMLTCAGYFCDDSKVNWKERRKMLFNIAGNADEAEILQAFGAGEELGNAVLDNGTDSAISAAKRTLQKINEEIAKIPIRIDELTRSLPVYDLSETENKSLRAEEIREEIGVIDGKLADNIRISKALDEKYANLSTWKREYNRRKDELREIAERDYNEYIKTLRGLKYDTDEKSANIVKLSKKSEIIQADIISKENLLAELRSNIIALNQKKLEIDEELFICPTCRQSLPETDEEAKRAALEENFAQEQESQYKVYTRNGKALKEAVESETAELTKLVAELSENQKDFIELSKKYDDLKSGEIKPSEPDYENDVRIAEIQQEIDSVERDISNINKVSGEELISEKKRLNFELDEIQKFISAGRLAADTNLRIGELKVLEREYASKAAEQQKKLYELERYIIFKSEYLEGSVNKIFKTLRFKLFDTQINGGINECCICMIDGVEYNSANTAAKINSGLEIINVLCEYCETYVPVFIDGAESINNISGTLSQRISLAVTEEPELTVRNEATIITIPVEKGA